MSRAEVLFYVRRFEWTGALGITLRPSKRNPPERRGYHPRDMWGGKEMAALFSVSHQWYEEIFVAFYSRFRFAIHKPVMTYWPYNGFRLSFLTLDAMQHIQNITLGAKLDDLKDPATTLLQYYPEIAKELPRLGSVVVRITRGAPKGLEVYVPLDSQVQFQANLLAICRSFSHVPKLAIECMPLLHYNTLDGHPELLEPDEAGGLTFSLLVQRCRDVLASDNHERNVAILQSEDKDRNLLEW